MAKTVKTYETTASQSDFGNPDQTLIIFDWDDTLCPSCWIQDNSPPLSFFRPAPDDPLFLTPLRRLEILVEALLSTSLQLGEVVIVTNAQEPWVESSCRNFLPGLEPILKRIRVLYAHSVYEALGLDSADAALPAGAFAAATQELQRQASLHHGFDDRGHGAPGMFMPRSDSVKKGALAGTTGLVTDTTGGLTVATTETGDTVDFESAPQRWKEAAFRQEITRFYSRYRGQSWKNIVSIGDSVFERDALRSVVEVRPTKKRRCRTKTAKMLDEPTIEELIKQVKVVHEGIALMVQYDGNIDVEIDEKDIDFDVEAIETLRGR